MIFCAPAVIEVVARRSCCDRGRSALVVACAIDCIGTLDVGVVGWLLRDLFDGICALDVGVVDVGEPAAVRSSARLVVVDVGGCAVGSLVSARWMLVLMAGCCRFG